MVVAAAFLPSLFLALVIHRLDRHREPISKFLLAFCLGVLSPMGVFMLAPFISSGLSAEGSP